jgi:hypothetical protein
VIDYFLGHNSSVAEIGRLLIAWVILEREAAYQRSGNVNRKAEDRPKHKDNWCRFLVHRLASGCTTAEGLIENKVTFVTFNYDLSLEEEIARGLDATERFKSTRDKFLTGDRFLHVYGKIQEPGRSLKPGDREIRALVAKYHVDDPNQAAILFAQKNAIDRAYRASRGSHRSR